MAAGTIFLDVLVWKVDLADQSGQHRKQDNHESAALHRLKGHEGSIHRYLENFYAFLI